MNNFKLLFIVVTTEEAQPLLDAKQENDMMYPICDAEGIKKYGEGAYFVEVNFCDRVQGNDLNY